MIVLDASAVVDLVIRNPFAEWVLRQIETVEVRAPAHQPAEVLSAIARLARSQRIWAEEARRALENAVALPQSLVEIGPLHVRRAFAMHETIRVSDGLYVALAEQLGCPLVTTDHKLARSGAPCEIRTPPADPGPVPAPR